METWCVGEAGVAQLVEQLTCNQQVGGSIPFASSLRRQDTEPWRETSAPARRPASEEGGYPSGQREQTVNLSASAFGGSNPPLPTQPREAGCATQGRFQGPRLRWFWFGDDTVNSVSLLGPGRQGLRGATQARLRGNSSVGRAPAFQAGGRGFEPRFPLLEVVAAVVRDSTGREALVAQLAEHFLGKEEVTGSIPVEGSHPR